MSLGHLTSVLWWPPELLQAEPTWIPRCWPPIKFCLKWFHLEIPFLALRIKVKQILWKKFISHVLVAQSYPTLCDLMDYSSVHGILQARVLEWVAIPFSTGSSWRRDQTQVSCIAGRFFTACTTREDHRRFFKKEKINLLKVIRTFPIWRNSLLCHLYKFPNVAVTKYHTLGDLHKRNVFSQSSGD